MNLPNKLTTFRVILIPFFVFFMLAPDMTGINNYIAVAIFIVASLTDLLDGKIARKYNLVTNFGSFGGQAFGVFCDDLSDSDRTACSMDCCHYYCKRIYHQRIPSDRVRQWSCHCSKLLGQI